MPDLDDRDTFPSLVGQGLIAMPGIGDSRFERTVVYLCMHDADGAMGIVVNKPDPKRHFGDVAHELDLPVADAAGDDVLNAPVLAGGPVDKSRGFVLHSPDGGDDGSVEVAEGVHLSTSLEILKAIIGGKGPERFLFALGIATWSAGQLDREILDNVWLNTPLDADTLFETPAPLFYAASLSTLGIDLNHLSPTAGRG
ncbi:MAG: YqgE/AlgH family protein [Devosiaceae bacterium]|nr:YqgE/AlgH family protein [Devosiaceae bacterium MH13]